MLLRQEPIIFTVKWVRFPGLQTVVLSKMFIVYVASTAAVSFLLPLLYVCSHSALLLTIPQISHYCSVTVIVAIFLLHCELYI